MPCFWGVVVLHSLACVVLVRSYRFVRPLPAKQLGSSARTEDDDDDDDGAGFSFAWRIGSLFEELYRG